MSTAQAILRVPAKGRSRVIGAPRSLFERPACGSCGARTMLCRREPHPTGDAALELATFECPQCAHRQTQTIASVDKTPLAQPD
jgi:hypothetical protein